MIYIGNLITKQDYIITLNLQKNRLRRWVTADEFWQEYFDELRESEA